MVVKKRTKFKAAFKKKSSSKRTARKAVQGKKCQKLFLKNPRVSKKQSSFSAEFPLRTRIKVVGIGGGGGSIVSEIARSLKKASFVIADTDVRALKKSSGAKRFYFGQNLTHGLGTGMNPELARRAAEKEKEKIAKIFEGQDITILVASLGGGVGSGATPVFAEAARNSGSIALGIFTLPFKFEGGKKSKISHNSLQSLRDSLNASITIANERIFKVIDEKTSITGAFSVVNKNLIESLESLIETIYNPGLINIDFADIQTILKGKGKLAFLNTAQAVGKTGAEEIIKNIFNNPLYNYNLIAEKILFNISGGSNLSMVDVEKISKNIANLNPKAKIIFGISRSSKSKNRIKATLLVTGPSRLAQSSLSGQRDKKVEKKEKPAPKRKITKEKKKPPASSSKTPDADKKQKEKKISVKPKTDKSVPVTTPAPLPEAPLKTEQKTESKRRAKIRRNALEIKKAEEIEESKKWAQEKEWEIPAFLRRIKGQKSTN